MTDELDALVKRLDDMSDLSRDHAAGLLDLGHKVAVNQAITAITTLRAQLAEARAAAFSREKEWADIAGEERTRADRAEAALAAQIEADAAICTDIMGYDCMKADGETYQPMWVQKVAKGMVSLARQDIRNQPHERSALDNYREKVLREAYDSLFKHPGFIHAISGQKFKAVKLEDAAEGILALGLNKLREG